MKRMVGRRLVDDQAPAAVHQVTVHRRWWQFNHVFRSTTPIGNIPTVNDGVIVNVKDGVLVVDQGHPNVQYYAPGAWRRMVSKRIDFKVPGLPR